MKEADLAITEVLEKAATPGPWHRFEAEGYNLIGYEPGYEAQIRLGTFPVGQGLADLRFVIHARDAVPVLVARSGGSGLSPLRRWPGGNTTMTAGLARVAIPTSVATCVSSLPSFVTTPASTIHLARVTSARLRALSRYEVSVSPPDNARRVSGQGRLLGCDVDD